MNKNVSLPGLGHSGVSARVPSVALAHPDPWSEGVKVELIPGNGEMALFPGRLVLVP